MSIYRHLTSSRNGEERHTDILSQTYLSANALLETIYHLPCFCQ